MESENKNNVEKGSIHKVLAHSYFVYFLFFLVGVSLDIFFRFNVFNNIGVTIFGFVLLISATFLILWAQRTSRNLKKDIITKETFCHGPYCFTRSPTHWGLFLLMLGFGLVTGAFFVILLSFVSFIFAKFTFLDKEEKLLAAKYGNPYLEYKKTVKL